MNYRDEMVRKFRDEACAILDFWANYRDDAFGGFYSYSSFTGEINPQAEKGVLLHSRILWAFSKGYNVLKEKKYLELAKHCYDFLKDVCYDKVTGGVYWSVSYDGKVLDSQKHIYNQGFFIYALSEYYLASGDAEALDLALKVFHLCEEHAFDEVYGGYREAFDRYFKPIENTLVCDTAEGILTEKSMNTHLHIMEAYTKLYEASHDEIVYKKLYELTKLILEKIIDEDSHYGLFFTRDWRCASKDISFGHDIEGTWLMDKAADQIKDAEFVNKLKAVTLKMAEVTAWQALDYDGAVFSELREGHLLDADRIWWVQAESMVGFMNAFEKSGRQKFLKLSLDCFRIIVSQLKDKVNDEWFWKVNRYGVPYEDKPKVEPWKCPYHNARACLEMYSRLMSADCEQLNVF